MIFVATDDVDTNVLRVVRRGLDGGHSAPGSRIREIYQHSLANLARAVAVFDEVVLYDNSLHDQPPRLVRIYEAQRVTLEAPPLPRWLVATLGDR